MSARAYALIKEAIDLFREEDGASELGAYRDVVTDVLHRAYEDHDINKGEKTPSVRLLLKNMILMEGSPCSRRKSKTENLKESPLSPETNSLYT